MATIIAGQPPVGTGQPVSLFSLRGGLTLTAISGGSTRWNAMGAADTVTSITVGGTEILGSTITYATSVAATCRAAIKVINAYNSPYWATFEGTDIIYIWPRDGSSSVVATVTTTEAGFTATDVDMDTYQAFVAAARWPSGNNGAGDAFADTKMYRIGFDYSSFRAIDSSTLTGFKAVELVLQTEDQTLAVYIGPEGSTTLSATPGDNDLEERTFGVLGCALGTQSVFAQSGAAQNPTYHVRGW